MIEVVDGFLDGSGFTENGAVVTDLDGTAVHEDQGRTYIPPPVEFGLRAIYDRGRPVILNSLRFPLSVMRTFGKEWLTISGAPIPIVSMNGSQLGYVSTDKRSELSFEEINAFPLAPAEIDTVLNGVHALLKDNIREVLLFYYPRDWRLGEIIWTPIPEKVVHVKEKYKSASSVIAVEPAKLAEMLHAEDICMIFLLIEKSADDLMAYQHSKPSSFFTATGVDKLSGTIKMLDHLGCDIASSIGAGDTLMDIFLDDVGLSVQIGPQKLPFRGANGTIALQNSQELGDLLFYIAGSAYKHLNAKQQKVGQRN